MKDTRKTARLISASDQWLVRLSDRYAMFVIGISALYFLGTPPFRKVVVKVQPSYIKVKMTSVRVVLSTTTLSRVNSFQGQRIWEFILCFVPFFNQNSLTAPRITARSRSYTRPDKALRQTKKYSTLILRGKNAHGQLNESK